MLNTEKRSAPINIRCYQAQKSLIDRAAALQMKNRSDFILEAACREAENVLLDQRLFVWDEEQFAAFDRAIQRPVADETKLQKIRDAKGPWAE